MMIKSLISSCRFRPFPPLFGKHLYVFKKDLDLFLITFLSFSNRAEMSLEFGPWAHSNACTLIPKSRRLQITTSTLVELKCRENASYMYCGPALDDQ